MDYRTASRQNKIAECAFFERLSESASEPPNAITTLKLWAWRYRERSKMRREVDQFTDEMLKDLGLTRAEARTIAKTPFWRGYR